MSSHVEIRDPRGFLSLQVAMGTGTEAFDTQATLTDVA